MYFVERASSHASFLRIFDSNAPSANHHLNNKKKSSAQCSMLYVVSPSSANHTMPLQSSLAASNPQSKPKTRFTTKTLQITRRREKSASHTLEIICKVLHIVSRRHAWMCWLLLFWYIWMVRAPCGHPLSWSFINRTD